MNKEKTHQLTTSKTFCMAPWVHMYASPTGDAGPCCIGRTQRDIYGFHTPMSDSKNQNMTEIMNSDPMKKLRVDMLSGVKNPICGQCHEQEDLGINNFRRNMNTEYASHFDEVMTATEEDGSLSSFKMRYFDIRFSNICNFKCRTCGPAFSSQWEQEELKHKVLTARIIPKNNNPKLLQEIIEQIPNIQTAYFAGGEPLITEEHYILLEEMIRQKRTDIGLRYNTNLSTLRFKDKDLMSLWKQFDKKINVAASIDHYGDRAEYIRHGTNWAQIESNFKLVKQSPFIRLQINTVMSLYNYTTISEFYNYLFDKQLYLPTDVTYSIYNMDSPKHFSPVILPQQHRVFGKEKILKLLITMKLRGYSKDQMNQLSQSINWVDASPQSMWEQHKNAFREETNKIDSFRGESFVRTFPELSGLMTD